MKNIYKNFIEGQDVTPEINLIEGYISTWKTKNNEIMIVYCFADPDQEDTFYYDYTFLTEKQVNEVFTDDINDEDRAGLLSFTGQTFEEFLSNSIINKISDIQQYNGWFFNECKQASTIEEVLQDLGLIY